MQHNVQCVSVALQMYAATCCRQKEIAVSIAGCNKVAYELVQAHSDFGTRGISVAVRLAACNAGCNAYVELQNAVQAEARGRAAAVKIAGWYKRCIETRPARLTLKARRQLLPLTSLDRKTEDEQKAAAAAAILELLKDIQRGHRFARAVKEFLSKVCTTVSVAGKQMPCFDELL